MSYFMGIDGDGDGDEMTNRVHIDAPAGVIEIEGEKDFVEGLLARLFPLIEEAGFGTRAPIHTGDITPSASQASLSDSVVVEESPEKGKQRRRASKATPKGQSCADRIATLKSDGFFKELRSNIEVVEGLKAKGWIHQPNQVAAALTNLFGRSQIQRTKEGNSAWKFFWDRD